MTLDQYYELPVPRNEDLEEYRSYRDFPFDPDDPRSKEELVSCLDKSNGLGLKGLSFYHRSDGFNAPYYEKLKGTESTIRLRSGVAEKLKKINDRIASHDLEFFLLDGYRSVSCQQGIYDWMEKYIRKQMPDASDEIIYDNLGNFISDPSVFKLDNPKTWTSHITGAAIDLTLRQKSTGEFLYMGGVFDDPSEVSFTGYYEYSKKPGSVRLPESESATHHEARRNRRLLYGLMIEEGFSNLPTEWWHFDYGNQLWSKNRKFVEPDFKTVAFYGAVVG